MSKFLVITAALLALAGCETTKGIGKDISNVGNTVTGAASEVQDAVTE